MSRLVESDIEMVTARMAQYDQKFREQTGRTLEETARYAVGLEDYIKKIDGKSGAVNLHYSTAVVPVTSGLGVIGGFSDTVCGILRYCGIDAWVTKNTDVAGLQEAYKEKAEMVFLADDAIFSAFLLKDRWIYSDNGYATGIGYGAALKLAMDRRTEADGIPMRTKTEENPQKVLVLGAGPVGTAAAAWLDQKEVPVFLCDVIEEKAQKAVEGLKQASVLKPDHRKSEFQYIVDATPVRGTLTKEDVTDQTIIASPGMPLGVTEEAAKKAEVIFNPLELGVITMYYDCLKQENEKRQ